MQFQLVNIFLFPCIHIDTEKQWLLKGRVIQLTHSRSHGRLAYLPGFGSVYEIAPTHPNPLLLSTWWFEPKNHLLPFICCVKHMTPPQKKSLVYIPRFQKRDLLWHLTTIKRLCPRKEAHRRQNRKPILLYLAQDRLLLTHRLDVSCNNHLNA